MEGHDIPFLQPPPKKLKENNLSNEIVNMKEQSAQHDQSENVPNSSRPLHEDSDDEEEEEEEDRDSSEAPRRLRRAETVLQSRTGRFILILDNCRESFSQQAMIRTAESLGVQYIYSIQSQSPEKSRHRMCKSVMKGAKSWVTVRVFSSAQQCIEHLHQEGAELWSLVDSELGFENPRPLVNFDANSSNDDSMSDQTQMYVFFTLEQRTRTELSSGL